MPPITSASPTTAAAPAVQPPGPQKSSVTIGELEAGYSLQYSE